MAFHRAQMQECSGGYISAEVSIGVNLNSPGLALVPVLGRSCWHLGDVVFLHWPPLCPSLVVCRRNGALGEKKVCNFSGLRIFRKVKI